MNERGISRVREMDFVARYGIPHWITPDDELLSLCPLRLRSSALTTEPVSGYKESMPSIKNVLVFIALIASQPQVYKLENPQAWTSEQVRTHVFTVWDGKVCVESSTYHGASSRSYHTPEQARELWTRYKTQGFVARA